jgi:hypothetical protein
VDTLPRRLGHRANKGASAPLAVRSRDVDYWRQPPLGMIELSQQITQPIKAKIHQPWIQTVQALDNAFDAAWH